MALIEEPRRINPLLRVAIAVSDRVTGRRMLPARLLAWYPRAAIGAGVLESLVAHHEPSERLLKLVRITASITANCAFCVDMNGFEYDRVGITDVDYARRISRSPLVFPEELTTALRAAFTERELVILATTAAQVNYWARVIQALGIPPAGFTEACPLPLE